ncbi:hypothetical protein FHR29_000296 [Sphingobacterium sp. JUb56]|nr:hypothetical protein [Sphingobacterium sp. JUb56]
MLFSIMNLSKSCGQDKITIMGDISLYKPTPEYAILSYCKEQT